MKEKGLIIVITLILLMPFILAGSVDDEIQKITHYAEEYETGNIDYVKLMLYMSSAREGLNEVLGATGKEMGGIVKQDKLTEVLGEPNEKTKWVWVEGENHDEKLDTAVPIWKKIVFDGKKIQIRMQAFPSIFKKMEFDGFEDDMDMGEMPEEGSIIYRLNFETEFKKPEEQINIKGKIGEIETLAKSGASMETLAKESVNAEIIFNNYFRQGSGKCEDIMKSVFGSENQRQIQQILLNEIEFFSGENFEAILRLEMCDDCEWSYINFDMRLEGRGNFKPPKQSSMGDSRKQYESFSDEQFKSKTQEMLESMKTDLASGNYAGAMSSSNSLRMLTEAWNEKANNVWEQVEIKRSGKTVEKNGNQNNAVVENEVSEGNNQNNEVVENTEGESETNENNVVVENTITGNFITGYVIEENNEQSEESKDPYYWIKQDQLQRQKSNELKKQNYENRKSFYLGLFSGYAKEEFYFSQINFEKRLIEEFKEKGEEICNNNVDDNGNEQVDCDDSQCGGKICGKGSVTENNETTEINYYCISGTCQVKEQEIIIIKKGFCGDRFCDAINNETIETCFKDCDFLGCPVYNAIECSGKVKFSGEDEKGCQLPPICIDEEKFCEVDEDCTQPKCGVVGCLKENENEQGICKIIDLIKCGAGECGDGEKQITKCNNNKEIVTGLCVDGIWEYPDVFCPDTPEGNCNQICGDKMSVMIPECPGDLKISGTYPDCNCDWKCDEIVNDECVMASDCGGENDVCSNGKCETIPGKIYVEPEEPRELPTVSPTPEPVVEPEPEEPFEEPILEPEEPLEEPIEEPVVETEEPALEPEPEITGNVIFGFFQTLINRFRMPEMAITGQVVDESGEIVDTGGDEVSSDDDGDDVIVDDTENYDPDGSDTGIDDGGDNMIVDDGRNEPEPDNKYNQGPDNNYDNSQEREERDNQEKQNNEKENKERCKIECARPCVDKCIREVCGESMDCNIDKESKSCEGGCSADSNCIDKCMSGDENWWQEFQNEDMYKEEKGVFQVGGGCRTERGRTEGYIWFGGWGDPYSQLEPLKQKYYEFGNEDWCKYEIENMIKQRKEIEKGFNQEFAVWFFEKYLPNSAEEWEQAVSGIFELYWNNVENQMRLANNMKCLEKNDITEIMDVNLINIEYETEYGKLEYWEELKIVKVPGMDESVNIISPYMRVWIFPSKEFIKYEMQESMKNHELPGSPEEKMERKNQEGLTEEQKIMVRGDKGEMQMIREISEKYGGSLDLVIQFKDYETNEVVFNLYARINEQDIMKVEPMLPSEVKQSDATVEMDFELLYEMIFVSEKDMMGDRIESPPWDRQMKPVQKIKEIGNGVKMWNRMRKLKGSAKITPEGDKAIEKMAGWVMENVMGGPGGPGGPGDEKEKDEGNKEVKPESFEQGMSGKVVWVS